MVENFKLTAIELKRQLKISIYLPKNYNDTDTSYPLIYVLDGQMMFHSLDDINKTFDMPDILDSFQKECICIGIHSPKIEEWRVSELCPYYIPDESDVDPSLSINFANYIVNILHPILKQRYRINENVYLLGFQEGAIFNLYSIFHYDLFKGAGVFSPKLEICKNLLEDIKENYKAEKKVFLYEGGKKSENTDLFYNLYSLFEDFKCDSLKLIYENEEENNNEYWQKHIPDFLEFIL